MVIRSLDSYVLSPAACRAQLWPPGTSREQGSGSSHPHGAYSVVRSSGRTHSDLRGVLVSLCCCSGGDVCVHGKSWGCGHVQTCSLGWSASVLCPGSVGSCPLCPEDSDGCWDQTRGRPGSCQLCAWREASGRLKVTGAQLLVRRGASSPRKLKRHHQELALPGHCFHVRCRGGWQGAVSVGPLLSGQNRGRESQLPPHEGQACRAPAQLQL